MRVKIYGRDKHINGKYSKNRGPINAFTVILGIFLFRKLVIRYFQPLEQYPDKTVLSTKY